MEWVIPCNEKYYDHKGAFENLEFIDWRQSTNVSVDDIVYIYVGKPRSLLMYKCQALEVDIVNPSNNDINNIWEIDICLNCNSKIHT